jgi:magnesium transporter
MYTILHRNSGGGIEKGLAISDIKAALADPGGLLWVDMCEPTEEEWKKVLVDTFNFHPLAVDDAIHEVNHPKVDDYGDYIYLVVHGARLDPADKQVKTEELDVFLGPNYLLTFHAAPISTVDEAIAKGLKDERRLRHGPDMVLAGLLEQVMDRYMSLMEDIDDELDRSEDDALKKPSQEMLTRLLDIRHSISNLRRILGPQRDAINRLARGDFKLIADKSRPYFRDVYDTAVRIMDIVESARDLAGGIMEITLTVASNNLNEIMRILMVVSVIIMPLTLLTGIYGMNMKWLPMADREWGFVFLMVVMLAIAGGLVVYFKKRKWL